MAPGGPPSAAAAVEVKASDVKAAESALASAKAAGLSPDILAQLTAAVEDRKRAAAAARPLGKRLQAASKRDEAIRKVARAQADEAKAAAALKTARAAVAAAMTAAAEAEAELAAIKAEVADPCTAGATSGGNEAVEALSALLRAVQTGSIAQVALAAATAEALLSGSTAAQPAAGPHLPGLVIFGRPPRPAADSDAEDGGVRSRSRSPPPTPAPQLAGGRAHRLLSSLFF